MSIAFALMFLALTVLAVVQGEPDAWLVPGVAICLGLMASLLARPEPAEPHTVRRRS